MSEDSSRFQAAIKQFDQANSQDPRQEVVEGQPRPRELVYAERMTHWLQRLEPRADEALRLAARCQHICRWEIPRDRYAMDRRGYHQWRTALMKFHAEKAGEILRRVGYAEDTVARVQALVQKKGLGQDPQVQLLEDVICVVFLENYFAEFSKAHDRDKLFPIIRKMWRKMSDTGRQAARSLELPGAQRSLIDQALDDAGADK